MSNHISEELPRLLTGDASRDVVMAAAEHLRNCPDCQQELVSAVVAHASLTSAQRFAPEIVAPQNTPGDRLPYVGNPVSELRSVDSDDSAEAPSDLSGVSRIGESRHAAGEPDARQLPNMSSMFAQIREEAAAKSVAQPKRRQRLLAVAAAAVVLAGGGVAIAEVAAHNSTTSSRHVALAAYQTGAKLHLGAHAAAATISGDKVDVNASGLPRLNSTHQYEVWLTDAQRVHMASIGFIASKDNKAALTVPAKVKLSEFTDIEVSVQPVGNSSYTNGTSIVRGAYGA